MKHLINASASIFFQQTPLTTLTNHGSPSKLIINVFLKQMPVLNLCLWEELISEHVA